MALFAKNTDIPIEKAAAPVATGPIPASVLLPPFSDEPTASVPRLPGYFPRPQGARGRADQWRIRSPRRRPVPDGLGKIQTPAARSLVGELHPSRPDSDRADPRHGRA